MGKKYHGAKEEGNETTDSAIAGWILVELAEFPKDTNSKRLA